MLSPRHTAWRALWVVALVGLLTGIFGIVQPTLAAAHDNNIHWNELGHDSRDPLYRSPAGPVPTNTQVRLRFRAAVNDLTSVQIRIWNDRIDQQSFVNMTRVATDDTFEWWEYTLNTGAQPTAYYYRFIANDGTNTAYYQDIAQDGGWGAPASEANDFGSWQLSVYDPAFTTPDWVKNAIIYQIFPDRFRDGDPANNTAAGTFFYEEVPGTIHRSGATDWNTVICDPRPTSGTATGCPGSYSRNFYGGDLQGILDQLDYIEDLGITAIYLNPIFESPSNHKYDTTDFSVIDDNFGDLALFQALAAEAKSRGIRIILDGVFNHTSSDSIYFDRYERHTSVGACEDVNSAYRNWYYFTDAATGPCDGPANYESWFGYDSLPKLKANDPAVRDLFWADGASSIGPYWMQWADGWRLDVAGDVDPGVTGDPNNDYWEQFRNAVRAVNPDTYIVGEEWGNATSWLLGTEWDATMNYQYGSALLSFWRDTPFNDNDHNSGSSAGSLNPISPSLVNERLLVWQERYPEESYYAQMNLLGSHDTSRSLFMLDHGHPSSPAELSQYPLDPNHDWTDAIVRLKGVVLMQMTLPGAPTVYYGDEVGLVGPQTWAGGKWEDDPYNRQPYPWLDETGTPYYVHLRDDSPSSPRGQLLAYHQALTTARNNHEALRVGSFDPLLVQDSPALYVYGRKMDDNSDAALVFINRSGAPEDITINVTGYVAFGATFDDALTPAVEAYTVGNDGLLTVPSVTPYGGALLVLTSTQDTPPTAVSDLSAIGGVSEVTLAWTAAPDADNYDIYRSHLSGGGYVFVANTANTTYVDTSVDNGKAYYYVVVSQKAATALISGHSNEASAIPQWDLSSAVRILQTPFTLDHVISTTDPTEAVYAQLYIAGATDDAAQTAAIAGIRAQVGYGETASTPDDSWTWFEMTPNPSFDVTTNNNDEYMGTLLPDAIGTYDYTVRFSADNGLTWFYVTVRDGGGSPIGELTVNPSDDAVAPSIPLDLSVTGTTSGSISLAWEASTDTKFLRALDSYRLYRAISPAQPEDFTLLATITQPTTTYVDLDVTANTTYEYYVTAVDDSFNESAASNIVTATAEDVLIDVTFITTVPAGTPDEPIVIVGNQDVWGPWNPALAVMTETAPNVWEWTGQFLTGTSIEFKHARGSWEKVEKDADGFAEIAHIHTITDSGDGTQTINTTVLNWRDPHVVSSIPADGDVNVDPASTIRLTFNKSIDFDAATIGDKVTVTDAASTAVSGSFSYDDATKTLTFTPDSALVDGVYTVTATTITASSGGDWQQVPFSLTFAVGDAVIAEDNLLLNGGFEEADGDKLPLNWKVKKPTKEKIKCDKPEKDKFNAHSGDCMFQSKGAVGKKTKIMQDVDLAAHSLNIGDVLNLTLHYNAKGAVNAKVKLQAKYIDGAEKSKHNIDLTAASDYTAVNATITLNSAQIDRVRVMIVNKSTSGRIRLDSVSLVKAEVAPIVPLDLPVNTELLPLPGE